jgi:hypothetical protein
VKKLLLLLLFSTTANANPYAEAIKIHSAVYSYISEVSPTLYMLNACNSYLYVPTLMFSVEQTYNLVPSNVKSYQIVNTIWKTQEHSIMDPRLEASLIMVKQGLRNPETVTEVQAACDALDSYVKTRFYWEYSIQGGQGK